MGGKDFPANIEKAKHYYELAVKQNHDSAMYKLGKILLEEAKTAPAQEKEYEERALKLFRNAANLRNIDAMVELAKYHMDRETDQDMTLAGEWISRAEQHFPCSERMREKVMRYRTQLDERSLPTESIEKVVERAESGSPHAMLRLAKYYLTSRQDQESLKQAIKWLTRAAESGQDEAMLELGNAYSVGFGVKPSQDMAFEWWKKAADAGNEKAQLILKADFDAIKSSSEGKKKH